MIHLFKYWASLIWDCVLLAENDDLLQKIFDDVWIQYDELGDAIVCHWLGTIVTMPIEFATTFCTRLRWHGPIQFIWKYTGRKSGLSIKRSAMKLNNRYKNSSEIIILLLFNNARMVLFVIAHIHMTCWTSICDSRFSVFKLNGCVRRESDQLFV